MGVTGLWRLLEPAGKPVPVETLENKVIAVDISIWLHQMVKGYQDTKGAPLPNAHLIGLFQRVCKLLYFRIKPVFVFDGGFPDLKKETIAKRQHNKLKYNSESERLKRELALLLSKKTAISSLLGKDISPKKGGTSNESNDDDLFKLPALPEQKEESESESDDEDTSSGSIVDLHSVDIESDKFKNLPVKEKYDLLIELKETRKMNSWGRIHELPKKSDNFSDFQLQRLLKRRKVQECLEETEKEMGDGGMSIVELESLLNEEGIDTKIESLPTRRIASDKTTRFLLISDVKQALENAKKKEVDNNPSISENTEEKSENKRKNTELEDDLEKAIKMSLECVDDHDKSNYTSKTDDSWTSVMTDSDYTEGTDSEDEDGFQYSDISSAKAYIMQYSDFTHKAIDTIVSSKNTVKPKTVQSKLDEILDELRKEKSIIMDKIELSSDDESKIKEHNVLEIDTINDSRLEFINANEVLDTSATQSSVIFVENSAQDVFLLDSSMENSCEENIVCTNLKDLNGCNSQQLCDKVSLNQDVINQKALELENHKENQLNEEIKSESESSDDDFEDVPDVQNESQKNIVQLTLNMNEPCEEEDDIFADVFMKADDTSISEIITCKPKSSEQVCNDGDNISKTGSKDAIGYTDSADDNKIDKEEDKLNLMRPSTSKIDSSKFEIGKNDSIEIRSLHIGVTKKNIEDPITDQNNVMKSKISNIEEPVANNDVIKTKVNSIEEPGKNIISVEKLNEMAEIVAHEEQELIQEKGRLDRIGRNITEEMTKDAQELLQIFGIPYIVAPMEAEAQCAFLESVNLTDGTITDDSDIWLFGGKTVYKNFFNQRKHVLQFLSERIEKSFNLTREQLVLLALLVGSDYTTGVDGIGPVTAMEILASFPFNKKQFLNETSKQGRYQQVITGLQEFKKWVKAGKRTDNTNLKKKLRNVSLTEDFPSVRVVQAYMEPNVEKSEEKFTWGELDITILRDYTKAKFGWSQNKLDEIINPVLKRLQERRSQKTVHDYFKRKVEFQSLEEQMSKRVKAAVHKMGPEKDSSELVPKDNEEAIPSKKKKVGLKRITKSTNKSVVLPGPSKISDEIHLPNVTVVSSIMDSTTGSDIVIPKTQRFQEIIPQREKDKQCLLQNKMKAIEVFRKTKIDRKKKATKRKAIIPKEKAELSESSDCD